MSLSVDEIERTMNTYHTAWLVCMIAACVFLVAAVVLFIVFRIPRVFMNLTGIERKRQIKENVGTEAQTARHKSVQKRKTVQPELPGVQQNSAYQMNAGQMQTTMLAGQNSSNIDSTVKLANSENTVLLSNNGGGAGVTDVLVAKAKPEKSTRSSVFNITQQIILVNTEEIIQL